MALPDRISPLVPSRPLCIVETNFDATFDEPKGTPKFSDFATTIVDTEGTMADLANNRIVVPEDALYYIELVWNGAAQTANPSIMVAASANILPVTPDDAKQLTLPS